MKLNEISKCPTVREVLDPYWIAVQRVKKTPLFKKLDGLKFSYDDRDYRLNCVSSEMVEKTGVMLFRSQKIDDHFLFKLHDQPKSLRHNDKAEKIPSDMGNPWDGHWSIYVRAEKQGLALVSQMPGETGIDNKFSNSSNMIYQQYVEILQKIYDMVNPFATS